MMQVTGEEGVSQADFVTQQKAFLVDMVYLQQDAFDPVDVSNDIERQKESFFLLHGICEAELRFADKAEARRWFSRLTDTFKNLNYSKRGSDPYHENRDQIASLVQEVSGS
jgi:V/A-type H+-transporting ATPase subunit A